MSIGAPYRWIRAHDGTDGGNLEFDMVEEENLFATFENGICDLPPTSTRRGSEILFKRSDLRAAPLSDAIEEPRRIGWICRGLSAGTNAFRVDNLDRAERMQPIDSLRSLNEPYQRACA